MTLIHIGLPKTGTTSLQLNLFDQHPEIFLIGNRDLRNHNAASYRPEMTDQILDAIRNQDSLDYSQHQVEEARDILVASQKVGQELVISDEFLTVTFDPVWRLTDRRIVAERLEATFPGAHILMTIRSQLSILGSLYSQLSRSVGVRYAAIPSYERWIQAELDLTTTGVMSMLNYDRVHGLYQDVFGAANVHVLTFEDLRQDPASFATTVCELAMVDASIGPALFTSSVARPSPSKWQIRLAQLEAKNPRFGSVLGSLRNATPQSVKDAARRIPAQGLDTRLSDELTEAIIARFESSNRAMAERTGLDLASLGYFGERP